MRLRRWRGGGRGADASPRVSGNRRSRLTERSLLISLLRPRGAALAAASALLLTQNTAALAGPYLVMIGIDQGIPPLAGPQHSYRILAATGAAFVGLIIVRYLTRRWYLALSGRIGQQILLDLRTRLFSRFQRLSIAFHERHSSGQMTTRLTADMDALAELTDGGLDELLLAALSVVSIAATLLWIDPPMALMTLAAFPPLVALSLWFKRSSAIAYRGTRESATAVVSFFMESLGGIRVVQAFRGERRNDRTFEAVNEEYQRANLTTLRLIAILAPGVTLVGNVTLAAVLTFGGHRVLLGQADVGVLAAFLLYLRRLFEPIHELSLLYNSLQSARAALEKAAAVLNETPTVREPEHPLPLATTGHQGEVRFEGVQFGYREDQIVLPSFDLLIPAGQTVAFVGATGAGKSTVAKLIARFYDPRSGTVSLDGVDLRRLAEGDLRRAVVMVTQENRLFSGTVARNIRLGNPSATREEIERAAAAVGALPFISELPRGFETEINGNDGSLSAGQRQLVVFAMAYLADPIVLILDEATSAMDIPSERMAQSALRTVLANRTAIVIAHRLSTVEIAERVLVLDDGLIVEDGAPSELIRAGGRYAALRSQWLRSLQEGSPYS